jgi:uncharacterized protein
MRLTSRYRIKNINNIIRFLNEIHVGRLATIDENGYPQVIPMNFVHLMTTTNTTNQNGKYINISNENQRYQQQATKDIKIKNSKFDSDTTENAYRQTYNHMIYMHSHHKGEKIENLLRNSKVGFEVDKEICFLPSYYFHPADASFADTLYTSIVIKGNASIVSDNKEKALAMNKMMQKYQSEGRYAELTQDSKSIIYLTVIKINVEKIEGKYKIGQEWTSSFRKDIAKKIIDREGMIKAREILKDMKINILEKGELEFPLSIGM